MLTSGPLASPDTFSPRRNGIESFSVQEGLWTEGQSEHGWPQPRLAGLGLAKEEGLGAQVAGEGSAPGLAHCKLKETGMQTSVPHSILLLCSCFLSGAMFSMHLLSVFCIRAPCHFMPPPQSPGGTLCVPPPLVKDPCFGSALSSISSTVKH